jgi:hypothetical protein
LSYIQMRKLRFVQWIKEDHPTASCHPCTLRHGRGDARRRLKWRF